LSEEKKPRGFQTLTAADRSRVARLGGLAAQARGTCHRYTSGEKSQAAGRKGGLENGRRRRERQQAAALADALTS
jgi:hypothetical protein